MLYGDQPVGLFEAGEIEVTTFLLGEVREISFDEPEIYPPDWYLPVKLAIRSEDVDFPRMAGAFDPEC